MLRIMEEAMVNKLDMKLNTKNTKELVCSKNGHAVIKIYLEINQ